jgi:biopolymer transport protein ExbD
MAKPTVKRRRVGSSSPGEVNMTPMIDCTFQLIIFFILTAQMANQDLAKLLVPKPYDSMAVSPEEGGPDVLPNRVIVNVVNKYGDEPEEKRNPADSGLVKHYQVGLTIVPEGDIETLKKIFEARRAKLTPAQKKDFFVEIRADRDVAFGGVEPVLRAAADANIAKMSITAIADPQKQQALRGGS